MHFLIHATRHQRGDQNLSVTVADFNAALVTAMRLRAYGYRKIKTTRNTPEELTISVGKRS